MALNLAIARELADAPEQPEQPRWSRGNFCGVLNNGYGATRK